MSTKETALTVTIPFDLYLKLMADTSQLVGIGQALIEFEWFPDHHASTLAGCVLRTSEARDAVVAAAKITIVERFQS